MTQKARIDGIVERTLYIRTLSGNGTAFAINIDDRQYLITARVKSPDVV